MVVKRKIEEIIDKGGHVHADLEKPKKEWKIFSLRMPIHLEKEIEKYLEDNIGISKTGFILQAIQEKLKRNEKI